MKKMLCALVVLLIGFCASAFADTEKEICFRGLEWGTPYDQVMATFADLDIKWNQPDVWNAHSIEKYTYGIEDRQFDTKCQYEVFSTIWETHTTVAGYNVKQIVLYFADTFDGDILPTDLEHTSFYMGRYNLTVEDEETAYADLLSKLCSLYGNDYEEYTKPGLFTYYNAIWRGNNDTMVVLRRSNYKDDICIFYAWTGAEQLLSDAHEYLHRLEVEAEAAAAAAAGTEGL